MEDDGTDMMQNISHFCEDEQLKWFFITKSTVIISSLGNRGGTEVEGKSKRTKEVSEKGQKNP